MENRKEKGKDLEGLGDLFLEESPREKRLTRTQELLKEVYGKVMSINDIEAVIDAYEES